MNFWENMIRKLFKNPFFLSLLIFFVTLPTVLKLIRPGYYPVHDDFQVIRTFEMDKCFKDGQLPCRWVPDMGFGYGYPEFNYYAPLPYYVMELTHLTGFSFVACVKLFIILITLASAFGMYAFSKYLWKDKTVALVSTVLYVYLPFRAVDIYVRGALPELTAMAIIPFLFLFASKMVQGEKRSVFWFSLSSAVLLLSHNIGTLMIMPIVCLWIVFLVIKNKSWNRIPLIIAGLVIAVGLSAFFVIPAWVEKNYVHINTLTSGYFNYLAHFVSLKQMLFSIHWGYGVSQLGVGDDISLAVGITQWVLALIGFFVVIISKKFKHIFEILVFVGIGWLSLFLMHEKSSFIWEKLSLLSFVQFPWRFLIIAGFSFSVASGGVTFIKNKLLKWGIVVITILVTIFLYSGNFRPSQWLNISDKDKLSGVAWTKAITASLYDYLPVSAKKAPDFEAKAEPSIISGKVNISGDKGTNWQDWKVNVLSESAVLELQIYYFPNWSVKVDGKDAKIDYGNLHGLIDITLVKGEHVVEARLANTKVRGITNIMSVISLLGFIYVFIKRK